MFNGRLECTHLYVTLARENGLLCCSSLSHLFSLVRTSLRPCHQCTRSPPFSASPTTTLCSPLCFFCVSYSSRLAFLTHTG